MALRTEAGRRLLARKHPSVSADGSGRLPAFMWREYDEDIAAILAIEAEARAQGALHERLISEGEEAARTAGEDHREARQRHVPGAIDIFDLVCSCGWRQSKQADPDEDWWVHVTSEREFAFRPSTGSEEGGPTRVE